MTSIGRADTTLLWTILPEGTVHLLAYICPFVCNLSCCPRTHTNETPTRHATSDVFKSERNKHRNY